MSEDPKPVWFVDARHPDEPGNAFAGPAHVILNGEDITNICYRVERYEDGTMLAYCYRTDDAGNYILTADREDVETEIRTGDIEGLAN